MTQEKQIFDALIFVGRPASGKSEILDFILSTSPEIRRHRFHLGYPAIFDDFPLLWAWFEEDEILEKLGYPRLHSDPDGLFLYTYLWDVLIHRLSLGYQKTVRDDPDFHAHSTGLIEFSRGSEHGGYTAAFNHLSDQVLSRAAVLYVSVSYAESLRKNRRRYNPNRPDSILEHGLPDWKLERLYREDDWATFSAPNPHFLSIRGFSVPYAVFENEDDVTTVDPARMADRLAAVLDRLWSLERKSGRHEHAR
jgi:hypothetical protein